MDFLIPEMNGLEAARHGGSDSVDHHQSLDSVAEEARSAGVRGVCAKGEMDGLENAADTLIHGGTFFTEKAAV
jgi:hypothetical protein